jgi:hypothetical protein
VDKVCPQGFGKHGRPRQGLRVFWVKGFRALGVTVIGFWDLWVLGCEGFRVQVCKGSGPSRVRRAISGPRHEPISWGCALSVRGSGKPNEAE